MLENMEKQRKWSRIKAIRAQKHEKSKKAVTYKIIRDRYRKKVDSSHQSIIPIVYLIKQEIITAIR